MTLKRLTTKAMLVTGLFVLEALCGNIHVNQEGYYTFDKKIGIAIGATSDTFSILSSNESVVFKGKFIDGGTWNASEETTKIADFSDLVQPGKYKITAPGCNDSYEFTIGKNVYYDLTKASIKAFYYNRASCRLEQEHAGKWSREAGHDDGLVEIHSSAASEKRQAGFLIRSPKGWYDAGDYGKYIVNSGITVHSLFSAYLAFDSYFDTLELNIPESKNGVADLIDEILWNLRWMLTMQDPNDGGVYHKLTTANFCGDIMPNKDMETRYAIGKSVTATLDFAAVTSQASRILRKFEKSFPGLADSCLKASEYAWKWARANPTALFKKNPSGVGTGTYSDSDAKDEFAWAATELYLTTRQDSFFTIAYPTQLDTSFGIPGWNSVKILSLYSLFQTKDSLTSVVTSEQVDFAIKKVADGLLKRYTTHPYKCAMNKGDFYWGSNSVAANQGIGLIFGYLASNNADYKNAALGQIDYLLGKNPTGYCFVTGYGKNSPMNIHHRPSTADGIVEPVPGFLAGGPHSGQNENSNCGDNCIDYPSKLAALSYADDHRSYSTNEIAINWNAPMVFLSAAMENLQTTMSNVNKKKEIKTSHGSFSPTLQLKNGEIHFSSSQKLTGEIIFTDLRGNVISKALLNNQDNITIKSSWSNQIVIANVNTTNVSGKRFTSTKILNLLHK